MRLIGPEGLKAKGFDFSRGHLWRLIKAGLFPKPVKTHSASRNMWVEEEIDAHIRTLIAERDGAGAGR
ncbi:MAG TPA: AlpA family phage regulatory protein [Pseudolabrys sp.]|jgi:prophage regulatory protein|nr:AlpA family phage regulatory protein [Pseudolabrys sp.]